jgi:hypothetical protein
LGFILKINHLQRPLAFQLKNHPYLIENYNQEILLEIKNKNIPAVERNQPNPAPQEIFSRRHSINDALTLEKNDKEYIRERKKSLHDIKFRNNRFPIDKNKHKR